MTAFYMWFSKNPCVVLSPVATSAQCMYRCSLARDESTQWTHNHPGVALLIILVIEMLSNRIHAGCRSLLKQRCWVLRIARSSWQNSWLITSVASFTNETWSVKDDNECIHYSSPLGLGTDQYTGPIKNHRSWMLKPLASGQANKVPLRNWDGWIPVSLMVNPCIAEEDFVCVFEG